MKNLIQLISILSFILLNSQTKKYTQQEVDSFVKNELTEENYKQFERMLKSDKNLQGWSKYYSLLCLDFRAKAMNDSAVFYGQKAIDNFSNSLVKSEIDEESLLGVYFSLGLINYRKKEYELSIRHLQKALDLEKKYPYRYKSYIRGYLAGNHLKMGNNELALSYYHANLKDTVYTAIPQPYVVTLTRIAKLYTENYLNKIDSAIYYFKKAEKEAVNYPANLPIIYGTLADVYRYTHPDSTLHYYRLSKKSFESYIVEKNISPSNLNYFQIVIDNYVNIYDDKTDIAIKNLSRVVDSLPSRLNDKSDRDILLKAFDYLVLALEKNKNYYKANTLLKRKEKFEKEFHKVELQQKLTKLELEYETRQKEEEINNLKTQGIYQERITEQYKLLFFSGIGFLSLLLIVGGLGYRQNNLKNKYEKVSLEQRLLRSQMNPHFLFNALHTTQLLVHTNTEKASRYIVNLGKLLRLVLENSRENLVPLQDEITALNSYLNLKSNFSEEFDFTISIDENIDDQWCHIPPMLLQPIVENAILHGISGIDYRGEINISICKNNNSTLLCTISDNGRGINKKTKKSPTFRKKKSVSLDIIKERLAVIHKQTKIRMLLSISSNDKFTDTYQGTSVKFSLPYQSS